MLLICAPDLKSPNCDRDRGDVRLSHHQKPCCRTKSLLNGPIAMEIHGHGCSAGETDGFREIDVPVDLAALGALFLTSTFGKTMQKLACNANPGNRSAFSDCCNASKASSDSHVGLLLRQAFRYGRHHRHRFHPCTEPQSHTKANLPPILIIC